MKNLFASLVKFQAQVPTIVKDKTNPFFKSKYSDLASVINGVSETLAKCELGIVHQIRVEGDKNILKTILFHSSGELLESEVNIPSQSDPQKLGSLITYLKRYSYMAILGIASEEDDDGNAASQHHGAQSPLRQDTPRPATEKQKDLVRMLCDQVGEQFPNIKDFDHASKIIDRLNQLKIERKTVKGNTFQIGKQHE